MKLSDVLDKYYVVAQNQSEIVGFDTEEDEDVIRIAWSDSDGWNVHSQRFEDQDIKIVDTIKGCFQVTTVDDGEVVQFIALDGVDLENVS